MRMLGMDQVAREPLEKALALDPNSADAHANLGMVYLAAGERDRARAHLETALRLDPRSQTARLGLARLAQTKP